VGAVLSCLFLSGIGHAQPSSLVRSERVFEFRGVKYVTPVPNDPPATPSWTPGAGEPPLTAAGALRAVEPEFQKTFAATGAFKLNSINLSRQGSGWMYMVAYLQTAESAKAENLKTRSGTSTLQTLLPVIYYVTLDGTVYAPKPKDG
jgi:hypothetical protein